MFDFVKGLFKRSKVEEPTEVNPFIDTDGQEWMLGHPGTIATGRSSYGSGTLLHGVARHPNDNLRACDMKKCVRPSIATIGTYDELDVDIPDATKNPIPRGKLPLYQEYRLCDRCYKKYGRGPGTKWALTSHPVYDADTHEQTQKKLATKTRKTSK